MEITFSKIKLFFLIGLIYSSKGFAPVNLCPEMTEYLKQFPEGERLIYALYLQDLSQRCGKMSACLSCGSTIQDRIASSCHTQTTTEAEKIEQPSVPVVPAARGRGSRGRRGARGARGTRGRPVKAGKEIVNHSHTVDARSIARAEPEAKN